MQKLLRVSCLNQLLAVGSLLASMPALAQTALSDQPVLTVQSIPGNLALTLSVEFPTALGVAYPSVAYSTASTFLGYFDPAKCYTYVYNGTAPATGYFQPAGLATNHACSSKWSGNFLNWATMQTIDPFRWALTGGYRSQDDATTTILERAWASGQGGTAPDRTMTGSSLISGATPMNWSTLSVHVASMANKFRIVNGSSFVSNSVFMNGNSPQSVSGGANYDIYARVKVCDSSSGAGGLESNCKQYGTSYKPEGLIQQYSDRIRFAAFGYLNDSDIKRDGGVLRARMAYVGPTQPVPGANPITNPAAEWSAADGTMVANPDPTDASTTASAYGVPVGNSGVMNYLNKFGEISQSYKTYDPVSELYYAALRYYRNLGNVPEWTNKYQTNASATTANITTYVDGFPVITNWDDPILYACQKNFILGIGDENTHADRNVPGNTSPSSNEPTKPSSVTSDTSVDAGNATNIVGTMAGISSLASKYNYPTCCNNNGALIAGLAYDANTTDIRPDDPNNAKTLGRQSVQTYWVDVLESGFYSNNQYYLATKYGGFTVPDGFQPYAQTADIPQSWWHTGASTDTVGSQLRPDNYYTADRPDLMINGLTSAFASIASKLKAFTTSFSTSSAQVVNTSLGSYATQYDARDWSGELVASTTTLSTSGAAPTMVEAWRFSTKLATQATGTGWDTGRFIVTYNTATKAGVPFRSASLGTTQLGTLDTSYRSGNDSSDYLNYVRGDRSQEQNSTVSGSSKAYRTRSSLLGDIVDSKVLPVAPPAAAYSEDTNYGYAAFKTTYSTRTTMLFVGSNDGMLHAIDGSLTGSTAGKELFAYVPSAIYAGPNNTPNTDGLAALGNPNFVHHYYVDATPVSADLDFGKTVGGTGTDWRTILVGGLGKGGKSFYAIDITNPATFTNEASVASKVLWEFTDADLGYTYGQPAIVKTKKYGWVVIFASGYNNSSGIAYLYLVNPRTGALLEKISTGTGTTSAPAGMAQIQPFLLDITDFTADSVYAGDLLGNLWRFDMTATSGSYPGPTKLAQLTDSAGAAQSVTSRPLIVVQPGTNKRWVTVGTGRLLASSDVGSSQIQSYYAIMDGMASHPSQAADLPAGITFPIRRGNLHHLTDLTQPIVLNLATEMGWYLDVGTTASPGWRVVTDSSSFLGSVIFSSLLPSVAGSNAACNTSGQSNVYVIDLGSGQSQLPNNVAYMATPAVVTDLRVLSPGDLYVGSDDGKVSPPQSLPKLNMPGYTRLNWREIPVKN